MEKGVCAMPTHKHTHCIYVVLCVAVQGVFCRFGECRAHIINIHNCDGSFAGFFDRKWRWTGALALRTSTEKRKTLQGPFSVMRSPKQRRQFALLMASKVIFASNSWNFKIEFYSALRSIKNLRGRRAYSHSPPSNYSPALLAP